MRAKSKSDALEYKYPGDVMKQLTILRP